LTQALTKNVSPSAKRAFASTTAKAKTTIMAVMPDKTAAEEIKAAAEEEIKAAAEEETRAAGAAEIRAVG
jgi:hypothetical protein